MENELEVRLTRKIKDVQGQLIGSVSQLSQMISKLGHPTVISYLRTPGLISHSILSNTTADDHSQYLRTDGTRALTGDWNIGASRKIQAEMIQARSSAGLKLYEDGGAGIFVEDGGNVGVGTADPTALFDINSDIIRLRTAKTPASSSASGNAGDICWDANYIYICTATDTWERIPNLPWVAYKAAQYVFNFSTIIGLGKPTLVNRGVFNGFSLPIYAADNEELFGCMCTPLDWEGVLDPVIIVGGWLDTANTDKKFKLQVSVETANFAGNDVVPNTTNDYEVETTTGTWAQYTSYTASFTLSATTIGMNSGYPLAIRIRRIAASSDEISGEVVVEGALLKYAVNKFGAVS